MPLTRHSEPKPRSRVLCHALLLLFLLGGLAGAPGWEGPIRRFRLTWSGTPSERTRIACAWGNLR